MEPGSNFEIRIRRQTPSPKSNNEMAISSLITPHKMFIIPSIDSMALEERLVTIWLTEFNHSINARSYSFVSTILNKYSASTHAFVYMKGRKCGAHDDNTLHKRRERSRRIFTEGGNVFHFTVEKED